MRQFLRDMIDAEMDMVKWLARTAARGRVPRYPMDGVQSDWDAVMSDLVVTISDFGVASNRVIQRHSKDRDE